MSNVKYSKEEFDLDIQKIEDKQFKLWVEETCMWIDTSIENMYYYLPMNWKFHSCNKLYDYYCKYLKN